MADTSTYLRQDGRQILDPDGNVVHLKGVNIGGWLVTEDWMCGIHDRDDAASGRFVLETLRARFGCERARELEAAWEDSFITEHDFQRIAELGFNLVRIPFGYLNLLPDALGLGNDEYPEVTDLDFARMDWAVQQAAANGLYVLFDYHIWWGQQAGWTSKTGEEGEEIRKAAYDHIAFGGEDDELRHEERRHAIEVWTAVIEHYRGEGQIAAFELINEANGGVWGTQFLYEALRGVDEARLFLVGENPEAPCSDWFNVMYGPHLYNCRGPDEDTDKATIAGDVQAIVDSTSSYNAPGFVGELHVFNDADEGVARKSLTVLLEALNENGIGWAMWAWKGLDVGDWTIVHCSQDARIDAVEDDFETILQRWQGLSEGCTENTQLLEAFLPGL